MKRILKFITGFGMAIWDAISVLLSVMLAFQLRYGFFDGIPLKYKQTVAIYFTTIFLLLILYNLILGCYSSVWTRISLSEITKNAIAISLAALTFYPANLIFHMNMPYEVIILIVVFLFLFTLLGRMSVRIFLETYTSVASLVNRANVKKILIYGAGEAGTYLARKLKTSPSECCKPVVFIDDDPSLWNRKIENIIVYGGMDRLDEAIKKFEISEVIVAIPSAKRELLKEILEYCKPNKCRLKRFGTTDNINDGNLEASTIAPVNLEDLLKRDSVQLDMDNIKKFVEDKVVLVTGGAGSIGSEICRQVLSLGSRLLLIMDIDENGLFDIENELKESFDADKFRPIVGSIRDIDRLQEIFRTHKPTVVFHAAAHKHVPMMEINPKEAIKNNVFGTYNLAKTAIDFSAEKFVLISTDKAVNPTNIMGASKRIAELIIQTLDKSSPVTDLSAVRFGNVLGSNGSVVPFFLKQIAAGGPVTVTHPEMRRYFMTIPEAVQLVLEAGAMAEGGEIFVLDMGEPVKIYDLAHDLIQLSGFEPEKDIKIEFTGLRPGEKLFEEISLAEEDVEKTKNNKIFICKPISINPEELASYINELYDSISGDDLEAIFSKVSDLVPTFKHKLISAQPDNSGNIYNANKTEAAI